MKVTERTILEVDYREFEKTVTKVYGKSYSFPADQECGNDTQHSFSHIDGLPIDDEWDAEKLNEFKTSGEYNRIARVLLNDLANKGLISKGDYLIYVSW